eukprot:TRINITY_DN31260_c0_g1_i1.p2 TRINITY_DN31260_c0_g1~~TRINITY_DN31260_c0_g1_i1.p2  ORF type:complete len:109 (-),score=8.28 TRINITY_DN31260_c0_g1_i1:224-550(-)
MTDHFGTPKTKTVDGVQVRTPALLDANAVLSLNEDAIESLVALSESIRCKRFSNVAKAFLESNELCIRYPYTRKMLQIALVLPLRNICGEAIQPPEADTHTAPWKARR